MIHVASFLIALISGAAVATGAFAFILVIGIIPRIMRKSWINNVILVEKFIVGGLLVGNISSLWHKSFGTSFGHGIVVIYGVATGVFVGCVAVALAEILHTIPIIVDRFKVRKGVKYIILFMAFGKMFGNIIYFLLGYDHF